MSKFYVGKVYGTDIPEEPPLYSILIDENQVAWQCHPPFDNKRGNPTWRSVGSFSVRNWRWLVTTHKLTLVYVGEVNEATEAGKN